MSVKILGGELKGLPLFVPDTDKTRPTSVLLKRRLFDSRQCLEGYKFYDLCAGSGAVGCEALSRGAESLEAVENSYIAYQSLLKNIRLIQEKLESDVSVKTLKTKLESWLVSFKNSYEQFGHEEKRSVILFFDPPYEQHQLYHKFFKSVFEDIDDFIGELWVESDLKKGPSPDFWQNYNQFERKKFKQGTRIIYIFSRI
jgi:16S rRNA (guanine966-N2)-methyltransferase